MRDARRLFPATEGLAYFNTSAVGLASRATAAALHGYVDEWLDSGLDYVAGEAAATTSREQFASIIGGRAADVALIPSVSAAAGLIASQFGPAEPGDNVVIGEREYSSNHFPWRQLAHKGYDVRQVPFRGGGLQVDDVVLRIDAGTKLLAFSAVQTATGFRADVRALSEVARAVGALVFVDGTQWVGAMAVGPDLDAIDVLSAPDHKYLLNAGRGMGYCYLSPEVQERVRPTSAGWRAGRVPFESYFGPDMDLSPTASRFDQSISWMAAVASTAAWDVFETFGAEAVFARNAELARSLRAATSEIGWAPTALDERHRSTVVAIPYAGDLPGAVAALRRSGVVVAARDGHLRLSVHLYNDEGDIAAACAALAEVPRPA